MDDYGVKSKTAFDITYGGCKNEQENIHFISEIVIKQEVMETSVVIETCQLPPPLSTPVLEAEKKECKPPKKRKAKRKCEIAAKIAMKKRNVMKKRKDF